MSGRVEPVFKDGDMPRDLRDEIVEVARRALDSEDEECKAAIMISSHLNKKYEPTWHAIVGRNFGCYVSAETKSFLYFYLGQKAILVFKAG